MRASMLGLIGLLSACSGGGFTRYEEAEPKNQYEAGSTHIAILAPIPWASVRETISPKYGLEPKDAYDKAIPTTAVFAQQLLNYLGSSISANFLGTSSGAALNNPQAPAGTGGSAAGTGSTQATGGSKPSAEQKSAQPNANDRAASNVKPVGKLADTLGTDPVLRYHAATALFHEVKIIDNYLDHAIKKPGYTAYLIRMNISITARMQNLPYNVYADISFFSETGSKLPVVAPLLMTDNVEAAEEQRARELIREAALSVSAITSGAGVGADLRGMQDQVDQAFARQYNGLFMVARGGENMLRVRVGARQTARGSFNLGAENRSITAFLLVPDDTKIVEVHSRQTMSHAVSGEELPSGVTTQYGAAIDHITESFDLKWSGRNVDCRISGSETRTPEQNTSRFTRARLTDLVLRGEKERFDYLVNTCFEGAPDRIEGNELWAQLMTAAANLPYSFVRIYL